MKQTTQTRKKNIHDAFFRRFFQDKRFAIDIFRKALPSTQFNLFAWESLKSEETSYFDHEGNEKKADLVFSVKLKKNRKRANLLILLEHKSYSDARMMQQILEYQTVLYAKHKKPLIPIVVHQGSTKLKTIQRFQNSLKDMTPTVRKHFGGIILDFTCLPVDLQSVDWNDENLTAGPIFYIMSKIRKMSLRTLGEFAKRCKQIGNRRIRERLLKEGSGYLNRYNPEKFSREKIGKVFNEVLDEGDEIMQKITFGEEMAKEEGKEEGREEGRKEVKKETALRMLEKRMDIATICECTGLTEKEVNALKAEKKAA